MEFIDLLPSPEMGSWLSEEFDQDFCYGAKASTYQNPVFATPPGSWALEVLNNTSEWIEQTKNLNDLNQLESFPDGILLDNLYFGPEELFGGIDTQKSEDEIVDNKFYELSPETLAASPIFELSHTPPESPQSQKLTTVKIKLKRVKRPKTPKCENSKKFKPEVIPPLTCVIPKIPNSQFEQNECQPTPKLQCQNDFSFVNDELHRIAEKEIFSIEEHFKFESFNNFPVPIISLRDAFDTGEADDFLDELLNNTVIEDNAELKIDLDDNFIELGNASPLSSISSFVPSPQYDYSEAEMSPSTLETTDESLLSSSKEMIEFLDEENSKHSKNLKTKKRTKISDKSRYLRKKEQNKQAALRYRMKKKQEDNSLSQIVKEEEEHQEKLKMEFSNLKQEIHIMKKLLREAFVVKKLVPENYFSKSN